MERPIEAVSLTLINGEQRQFLLSMGAIKRLKARFKAPTLKELLDRDVEAIGVPILYEAMLDRNGMTEDQLADMLPSHLVELGQAVQKLLGLSMPTPDPLPPTQETLQ